MASAASITTQPSESSEVTLRSMDIARLPSAQSLERFEATLDRVDAPPPHLEIPLARRTQFRNLPMVRVVILPKRINTDTVKS